MPPYFSVRRSTSQCGEPAVVGLSEEQPLKSSKARLQTTGSATNACRIMHATPVKNPPRIAKLTSMRAQAGVLRNSHTLGSQTYCGQLGIRL